MRHKIALKLRQQLRQQLRYDAVTHEPRGLGTPNTIDYIGLSAPGCGAPSKLTCHIDNAMPWHSSDHYPLFFLS